MFETLLSTPATNFPINPVYFVVALGEAFLLSLVVIWVYRHKLHFSTQGESFQTSMLIMAPLIALILMFIGSNLALSIGMVGALSIVRFRTILKDPLDLMYLFLLIGIGLGCGTYNFLMTLAGVAFILTAIYFVQTKTPAIKGGVLFLKDKNEEAVVAYSSEFLKRFPSAVQERIELGPSSAEITLILSSESTALLPTLQELRKAHPVEHLAYYTNRNDQ